MGKEGGSFYLRPIVSPFGESIRRYGFRRNQQETRQYHKNEAEILYGLLHIEGGQVGTNIIDRILHVEKLDRRKKEQKKPIRRVFLLGPAGIGKTTLKRQISREIVILSGGRIKPVDIDYGDIVALCEPRFGPYDQWESGADSEHWQGFTETMLKVIEGSEIKDLKEDERQVDSIENIGIGRTNKKDRGVTVLRRRMQEAKEKGIHQEDLYIVVHTDLRVPIIAGGERDDALTLSDEEAKAVLEERYGTKVVGSYEGSYFNQLSEVEKGRIIKYLLTKKSANSKAINALFNEIEELANELIFRPRREFRDGQEVVIRGRSIYDYKQIEIPPQMSSMSEEMKDRFQRLTYYYLHYTNNDLQLPRDRTIHVLSPLYNGKRTMYIDDRLAKTTLEEAKR